MLPGRHVSAAGLALLLSLATVFLVPGRAAAWDLKTEFTAPANLPNGEAPAGTNMTLKVRVTNVSGESSPAVRLSVYKYDHTCSGYPKNQPRPQGASTTYKEIGALAPGSSTEVTFIDDNTAIPAAGGAATMTICYKSALQTGTGGYYTDASNANHAASKTVKYVPPGTTTTGGGSSPLAVTVSNVRIAPTSCGPGEQWVEAIVNATQPVAGATLKVEGVTPVAQRTTSLRAGNNTVRVNVNYPASGTYNLTFVAASGSVQASQQYTANIPKCKGTLTVSAPAAGETVAAGGTYTVRWSSANVSRDDRITIRVFDGAAWQEVATDTANDGSQQVTMPNRSATNAKVQMFAEKVSALTYSRDFTLRAGGGAGTGTGTGTLSILQPAGGESVSAGQTVHIRWSSNGNTGSQVKIRLFRGTQYLRELTSAIANDGSESVTIPADTAAMSDARINVISEVATAMSNNFTVTGQGGGGGATTASIAVTAPSAGAQLNAGSNTTVTWSSSGNPGATVKIRLSLNGGAYTDLKTNVPNDGSEQVTLPEIYNHSAGTGSVVSTSQAKIEVASTSTTAKGVSANFSIKVPALRFSSNFYNMIAQRCSACHPNSGDSMLYPQKARASNDAMSSVDETVAPVIPFSTAISASEMLNRFKSVKAASGAYQRARDKIYVVPNDPERSGLHYKAQDSDSPIFEEALVIEGFNLKIQDWITLWIKQGGN